MVMSGEYDASVWHHTQVSDGHVSVHQHKLQC